MKYKLDSACAYCPDCNFGQDSWDRTCISCGKQSLVSGFRYIDLENLKYVYRRTTTRNLGGVKPLYFNVTHSGVSLPLGFVDNLWITYVGYLTKLI